MKRYVARDNLILDVIKWDRSQRILDLLYLLVGKVDVDVKTDQLLLLEENKKIDKGDYISIVLKPKAEVQVIPESKLRETCKEEVNMDHECKDCLFFVIQYRITPDTYWREMVVSRHPVCVWGERVRDLPSSRKPLWCPLE